MPYDYFNPLNPAGSNDAAQVWSNARLNQNALVDSINMGAMENWDATPSGANPSQPDQYLLINKDDNNQQIKMVFTWGTSGVSEGAPLQIIFSRSSDGVNFDVISTLAFSYTVLGAAPSTTWSRPI